jgi:hypothetical protein
MASVAGVIVVGLYASPIPRERVGGWPGAAKAGIVISAFAVLTTYKLGSVPAAVVTVALWLLFGLMIMDGAG